MADGICGCYVVMAVACVLCVTDVCAEGGPPDLGRCGWSVVSLAVDAG